MNSIAKFFIFLGIFFIFIGGAIILASKIKIPFLGKLPGDIFIKKDNFVFYFPLTTSILISIILTLILYLFSKR